MSIGTPLWLSSVRARPAAFSALVALSALAVVVSVLIPMLTNAVAMVGLRNQVAAARPPDDGIAITASAATSDQIPAAKSAVDFGLASAASTGDRLWGKPVRATSTAQVMRWTDPTGGGAERTSPLSLDDGRCRSIRVTAGRCPATVDEVAVPASVATSGGYPLRSTLVYRPVGATTTSTAVVVGVYDDTRGRGALMADPSRLVGSPVPYAVHDPLLGASGTASFSLPLRVTGSIRIARPIGLADVPQLRSALRTASAELADEDAATTSAILHTDLGDVLSDVQRQQAAATTLTAPIALQALALAWFALAFVTQRMARVRAIEWGIGRTRGVKRSAWLAVVFVEPVVAILLGSAIGYPIALGLAVLSSDAVLGAATGVAATDPGPLTSGALALVGSLVCLVVASSRSASLPLDALLRETTEPRRLSRVTYAAQVAVVLIAALVVFSGVTSRSVDGPQLALPLLLALVTGMIGMRVAVVVIRRSVRRRPRSIVGIMVGRGLARAPSVLVASVLMIVAGSLASYALELQLVAQRAQDDRAELVVGAASVLTVTTPAHSSLLTLVRRADPSGRVAMAAEEAGGDGLTGTDRVLAVDTTRLAAVSTWRPSWRGGIDLGALHPSGGRAIVMTGTRLRLAVTDLGNSNDGWKLPDHPLLLEATVATTDGWTTVRVGDLRAGTLTAAIPCTGGCRLIDLEVSDPRGAAANPWGAQFTVASISTDTQPAVQFSSWLTSDRWRDRVIGSADPSRTALFLAEPSGPSGLTLTVRDERGGQTAALEPASGPAELPAVLGARTETQSFTGLPHVVFGTDLSRQPALVQVVGRAPALPRSLTDGDLVDLGRLDEVADPATVVATREVWLAPGAHPAVRAALAREGVQVLRTDTVTAAKRAASATIIARALRLVTVTAAAALLLALLALTAAWIIDAPARRDEWRALRLAGCSPPTLRRIALLRFAMPAALATLLGAPAACIAFALTIDRLPLAVDESVGPPLDTTPPVLALALLTAGVAAALVLIGVAGSRLPDLRRLR